MLHSTHTPLPLSLTLLLHKPTTSLNTFTSLNKHTNTNTTSLHLNTATTSTSSKPVPNTKLYVVPPTPQTDGVEGPIELSPDTPSIFATDDDPTFLQLSTSVLLTASITVFLFRSIRRRVKRAKELRMRSTGAKSLKEEALDSLKAIGNMSVESTKKPTPIQALLGGISAGVIALILYKFTITIEAALNRQTLSDSFSARQITVTIRTIINGLCYLATFIFGFNSLGLFLYSGQLALNSLFEESANGDAKSDDKKEASSPELPSQSPNENSDSDQTS